MSVRKSILLKQETVTKIEAYRKQQEKIPNFSKAIDEIINTYLP